MDSPIEFLEKAVASYTPYLQPSGQLIDPVIGQPTQYGTPYHALCHAVLALKGNADTKKQHLDNAILGFDAALRHVTSPNLQPNISVISRETGQVSRDNHRDFFWPPLLKIYQILNNLGVPKTAGFSRQLASVEVPTMFKAAPPSNWAMVWLSGEWLRVKAGLSPHSVAQIDTWLGAFFEQHILLDQGLFLEPGLPNSYDLFTRYHMADMLRNGYDGAWHEQMETLMATGLARSVRVQLSDGSLASAHRSTGQTWTLGVQCAYFTHAANFFNEKNDSGLADQATDAAERAFAALIRWQRPNAPFCPVENRLPANYRVGYEHYTADGHYANLALAFLATAILNGFEATPKTPLSARPPRTLIEHAPTYRAITHAGHYSAHVNAAPQINYDGFGLTDLSFGPGRKLHFVSSVRHLESGNFYNMGIALRQTPGLSALEVMAQQELSLMGEIKTALNDTSIILTAQPKSQTYHYELTVHVYDRDVTIEERTPGLTGYKTLLIPYLRDWGGPDTTRVETSGGMVRMTMGHEMLCFEVFGEVENALDLPYGFENRRGLCGLLRLDLAEPREGISYRVVVER